MIDYVELLLADIPQQYKNRPKIVALIRAFGRQLNELIEFYSQMYTDRFITTAEGKQLDLIGNILVLSRKEAKDILGINGAVSDEDYRRLLIYKSQLNFGDATYKSIMNMLKVIHGEGLPFYVVEELEHPATLILETKKAPNTEPVQSMLGTQIPRAGGVGLIIRATERENVRFGVGITSALGIQINKEMEATDPDEYVICITDEDDNILCDGDGTILIDEDSNIPDAVFPEQPVPEIEEDIEPEEEEQEPEPTEPEEPEEPSDGEDNGSENGGEQP